VGFSGFFLNLQDNGPQVTSLTTLKTNFLEKTMTQRNEVLLAKVRESGWSIEEITCLTRIPEITIYNILSGREEAGSAVYQQFAWVLGCEVEELTNGA